MLWSDVCLSVAYIGPKSRTEKPRKTKIGTEVGHVTRDLDTTFKVTRSTCRGRGHIVVASRTACCYYTDSVHHELGECIKEHMKCLYSEIAHPKA